MFYDISSSNREATQEWLDGDTTIFDWSPHFHYIVNTLEGKSEKEAREREKRMRQKVAYCDALSGIPMERGDEGPYPWREATKARTMLLYSVDVMP